MTTKETRARIQRLEHDVAELSKQARWDRDRMSTIEHDALRRYNNTCNALEGIRKEQRVGEGFGGVELYNRFRDRLEAAAKRSPFQVGEKVRNLATRQYWFSKRFSLSVAQSVRIWKVSRGTVIPEPCYDYLREHRLNRRGALGPYVWVLCLDGKVRGAYPHNLERIQ